MIAQLEADIGTRAEADTGAGGLFEVGAGLVNAIYNHRLPTSGAASLFPYLSFDIENENQIDALDLASVEYEWRMHVFVSVETPAPMARGDAIMQRVYGNYSATQACTRGFHRWTPALSGSGWAADINVYQRTTRDHSEGMFHWIMEFKLILSR